MRKKNYNRHLSKAFSNMFNKPQLDNVSFQMSTSEIINVVLRKTL